MVSIDIVIMGGLLLFSVLVIGFAIGYRIGCADRDCLPARDAGDTEAEWDAKAD